MARRSKDKKAPATASVGDLRRKVDRLQRELARLLGDHARFSERLAKLRQEAGEPGFDLAAEQQALQQLVQANKTPLGERCLRAVFRELFSGLRSLTRPLRVAYLGPTYSYSHLAAIERFGSCAELVPVATIAAVFEELNRKQADFGIVPLENSTDGRVADTLGMFTRLPVQICGEVQLRIHHHLLARCPRADITEVYSKPQALSQCREWLSRHLPLARSVEITSTAAAAQLAADKQGAAAIASQQAATNYGLNVIAENIEDNPNNVTRFAVIGNHAERRTGKDKTAVMFEIAHSPGSLADALMIFKRNRLNLTWIESFPLPRTESEYLFFVEMEGHQDDGRVKRALAALQKKTVRLEVLGSYARAAPAE
jgi:chorismate mutase/prephenate dehydratase